MYSECCTDCVFYTIIQCYLFLVDHQHLKVVESNISLMAMLPQRELTPSQDTESMMDLGLTPTAVVLARLPKVYGWCMTTLYIVHVECT